MEQRFYDFKVVMYSIIDIEIASPYGLAPKEPLWGNDILLSKPEQGVIHSFFQVLTADDII
jgi:hypothetical protein